MVEVVLRCLAVGDSAVPATGMQSIPDQLARRLPDGVLRLDTPVTNITEGAVTTASGEVVRAANVVVATKGPAAAALLGLPAVGSRSVACVWFAADQAPFTHKLIALDGSSTGPALNVSVMTNVAPEYGPPGSTLIGAACPGRTDTDLEVAVHAPRCASARDDLAAEHHLHRRSTRLRPGRPGIVPDRLFSRVDRIARRSLDVHTGRGRRGCASISPKPSARCSSWSVTSSSGFSNEPNTTKP